ncbi:uncharacterized protein [Syngnathus scovelli]|uniref:uncharacterized protein isoform X2 n=1 Tax=Syngnathus scovelli TaxID=161590 RepID=UPI00210F989B|nr:zinc finger protein 638 isoform X2 [Syngnathus scovelli]
MYHHKTQSQGPQSFFNMPRPDHHQQHPNQHNSPASNMLSDFPFSRPTQLPDELESALAIRGARDTDRRITVHTSRPNQRQNQGSVSVTSQHGGYCSTLTSDNQTSSRRRPDWSNFQPPSKLFVNSASDDTYNSQKLKGPHQQAQSSRTGPAVASWVSSGSSSSQGKPPNSGAGDGQGLYTPESAGSILASFGLSNDDLEVLSHYPDDQLTPDTLPFILRDIQINKSDNQKTVSRNTQGKILSPSNTAQQIDSVSSDVPSLLTVTKTAGKVIDYRHASRVKDNTNKQMFKREKLSSEGVVQMLSSASSSKVEKAEKRQIRLVHMESGKHGDRDYRRTSGGHHKSSLSPRSESPLSKSRIIDKDYRRNISKQRLSFELRRELYSRRSRSSSPDTSGHSIHKTIPDSIFIRDFSGTSPKVFPHTCCLCHIQCDHNKDWIDHINTVNHTAACRDLRNKYPKWNPYLKSKCRVKSHRLHARHSPQDDRQLHCTGDSSHQSGVKHACDELDKHSADTSSNASFSKAEQSSKYGLHSSTTTVKKSTKPGTRINTSAKAVKPLSIPPPAKKKKTVAAASQDNIAGPQVYLTGIPQEASEQEVTKFVTSFGKINNVVLMPSSEEDIEMGDGQKIPEPAIDSVCSNSRPTIDSDKNSQKKDSDLSTEVSEADMNTSAKGLVLITEIPGGDWSASDVLKLIQPFGNLIDIISAPSVGKALVSLPDLKTAQEVVKVHTSIPAKIKDCEVKMFNIEELVSIDTPVALYNLLMQSFHPLENSSPVSWSSLLVINNVPDTPTGPSEVKKLVQRFGTVVKTLELNNVVICEMETGAMALSVYKRFQRFPCIVQNNPLFFSRKPDPKTNTQTQVFSPNLHLRKDLFENDEDHNTDAADQDKIAHSVELRKEHNILMGPQTVPIEDEVAGENGSLVTQDHWNVLSESALEPDKKTDKENVAVLKSIKKDESANETILQTTVNATELKKIHVGQCDSTDIAFSEFSKDTVEVDSGAETNHPRNKMAGSANEEIHLKTEVGKSGYQIKETGGHKLVDAEVGLNTRESEKVDKEAKKEKEFRGRGRKIGEQWVQKDSQRTKWDREQEERTIKERREMERNNEHGVPSSGLYESCRFETYKSNSNLGEQRISNKSDAELPKMDGVEDFDSFPLNMSEFVTVDEVGDVTDLNDFPLPPSPAASEKTTEQEKSQTKVPQDTHEVRPLDVIAQPKEKSDYPITDCQHQPMIIEDFITDFGHQRTISPGTSDSATSDVIGMLSCKIANPSTKTRQEFSPAIQKIVPTCQPEINETECIIMIETLPTPPISSKTVIDDSPSDQHTMKVKITSGNITSEEKKDKATAVVKSPLNEAQTVMENVQMREGTWMSFSSAEPGRHMMSDIPKVNEKKSEDKPRTETPMATDKTVHFDPSIPVGMEFLVPKTGFFCKACNRFFSGSKDTQITHCKSFKHFENVQKYLATKRTKGQLH